MAKAIIGIVLLGLALIVGIFYDKDFQKSLTKDLPDAPNMTHMFKMVSYSWVQLMKHIVNGVVGAIMKSVCAITMTLLIPIEFVQWVAWKIGGK